MENEKYKNVKRKTVDTEKVWKEKIRINKKEGGLTERKKDVGLQTKQRQGNKESVWSR